MTDGFRPIAASANGPISHIAIDSNESGDLDPTGELRVRLRFDGNVIPEWTLFFDTQRGRETGMWTYQSAVSTSAWTYRVTTSRELFRHAGAANRWEWTSVPTEIETAVSGQEVVVCIPRAALGGLPVRVAAAVLDDDPASTHWLPEAFLPGVPEQPVQSGPLDPAQPGAPISAELPSSPPEPARLAIHYGRRPWAVRGCGADDLACGVAQYAPFAHLVLGAGLEETSHPSHAQAVAFISALREGHPDLEVWGYISLIGGPAGPDGRRATVYTVDHIAQRATAWKEMGATGIFLDEADLCRPAFEDRCPLDRDGNPVLIDRARQQAAVGHVHDLGLPVFANAFSVADLAANDPAGTTNLGDGDAARPADMYLLENPSLSAGEPPGALDRQVSLAKLTLANRWRASTGIRIAAVDTSQGPAATEVSSPRVQEAQATARRYGLEAWGFTNFTYSSSDELGGDLAWPP